MNYKSTPYVSEDAIYKDRECLEQIKNKLQQLMDLTDEIHKLSAKRTKYYIPAAYYPIFSKDSNEMVAIRMITDDYGIKPW